MPVPVISLFFLVFMYKKSKQHTVNGKWVLCDIFLSSIKVVHTEILERYTENNLNPRIFLSKTLWWSTDLASGTALLSDKRELNFLYFNRLIQQILFYWGWKRQWLKVSTRWSQSLLVSQQNNSWEFCGVK